MSKYTTEVRYICENYSGLNESAGYNSIENVITSAAPKIFGRLVKTPGQADTYVDDLFPFWSNDPQIKLDFEKKILRHYYTREICEETVGLWKLRLIDRLNTIMPYYNQMYLSAQMEFDPFNDVDTIRLTNGSYSANDTHGRSTTETPGVTTTEHKTGSEQKSQFDTGTQKATSAYTDNLNTKSDGTTTDNSLDLYSDTPQGGINGLAGIETSDGSTPEQSSEYYWLTNARKISQNGTTNGKGQQVSVGDSEQNTTSTAQSDGDKNVDYTTQTSKTGHNSISETLTITDKHNNSDTEHYFGKQGGRSYSSMLNEYRTTFLNIDKMVLEELSDLFMLVW